MIPWIREKFREWVEGGAKRWAGEVEGKAGLEEALASAAIGAKRDLEIELGKIELRLELSQLTPRSAVLLFLLTRLYVTPAKTKRRSQGQSLRS